MKEQEPMKLEKEKAPLFHIGFIMDGNRRWARFHHLPLVEGYRRGMGRIEPIVKRCKELGVQVVTFYTFSVDNLKRPEKDLETLFGILRKEIPRTITRLEEEDVKFHSLGDLRLLPTDIKEELQRMENNTREQGGITLNLAIAYGGRDEIKRAFQRIVKKGMGGEEITTELISHNLDTADQPDPDFIIRTGKRHRLSDFLVWQGAYAELYFTDILWPDFTIEELDKAILWYRDQTRTFGR